MPAQELSAFLRHAAPLVTRSLLIAGEGGFFTLPDGRRLGFEIYGDPDGFPVIYCHGFPASRLEARLFHEDARDTGIMLVAADRPGYGGSDYQSGRGMPDWAGDMRVLADGLHLDRYSVMGMSGGAPYAVHCAAAGDARLHRLGLVCGLGPMDRPETLAGMGSPAGQRSR
mgnify:CR=1 FL=1